MIITNHLQFCVGVQTYADNILFVFIKLNLVIRIQISEQNDRKIIFNFNYQYPNTKYIIYNLIYYKNNIIHYILLNLIFFKLVIYF
jgi:hypothetical protein